jgi:hypothetical protein
VRFSTAEQAGAPSDRGKIVPAWHPSAIRIESAALAAKLEKKIAPIYSDAVKDSRIRRVIEVEVLVDETGKVADARIKSGHPLFNATALNAVGKWIYSPTYKNNKPVAVVSTVLLGFGTPDATCRISLDSSGNLKDSVGQPIAPNLVPEGAILTAPAHVPFGVFEDAMRNLSSQEINVRIREAQFVFSHGRLFHVVSKIFPRPPTRDSGIEPGNLVIRPSDNERFAAMARKALLLPPSNSGWVSRLNYRLFIEESGRVVGVQKINFDGVMPDIPDIERALAQMQVQANSKRNGKTIPTAIDITITVR